MSRPEQTIRRRPDGTIDTDHYVRRGKIARSVGMNFFFFKILRAGLGGLTTGTRQSWVRRKA